MIHPTYKKILLGSLLSVVVIAVGYIYALGHVYERARENADAQGDIELFERDIRALDYHKELLDVTEEERRLVNAYFVAEDGTVDFIGELEEAAVQYGVTPQISSIGIEPIKDDKLFETLHVDFSVRGSWEGVFNFSQYVNSVPRHITVRRMQVNTYQGGEEDVSGWSGTYSISVYKLKE